MTTEGNILRFGLPGVSRLKVFESIVEAWIFGRQSREDMTL